MARQWKGESDRAYVIRRKYFGIGKMEGGRRKEGYLSRRLVLPLLNNKLVGNNKRVGTLK